LPAWSAAGSADGAIGSRCKEWPGISGAAPR